MEERSRSGAVIGYSGTHWDWDRLHAKKSTSQALLLDNQHLAQEEWRKILALCKEDSGTYSIEAPDCLLISARLSPIHY